MEDKTQPTDAELVAAYLKGDEESLAVLFSRHLDSAHLFARTLVGPSEAAVVVGTGVGAGVEVATGVDACVLRVCWRFPFPANVANVLEPWETRASDAPFHEAAS